MRLTMKHDSNGISCRKDGYLFVLSKHAVAEGRGGVTDSEAEYMIIGVLGTHPKGLIVMPTTGHTLVEHTGFECAGSMCSTTASTKNLVSPGWLTPGRVGDLVHVADNVNVGWNGNTIKPKKPGRVYIASGENRAAGLPDISDIDPGRWVQLLAWRKRMKEIRGTERN